MSGAASFTEVLRHALTVYETLDHSGSLRQAFKHALRSQDNEKGLLFSVAIVGCRITIL